MTSAEGLAKPEEPTGLLAAVVAPGERLEGVSATGVFARLLLTSAESFAPTAPAGGLEGVTSAEVLEGFTGRRLSNDAMAWGFVFKRDGLLEGRTVPAMEGCNFISWSPAL